MNIKRRLPDLEFMLYDGLGEGLAAVMEVELDLMTLISPKVTRGARLVKGVKLILID
jgi:hypothetical protein